MKRNIELEKAIGFLEAGDWESAHPIAQDDPSELGCWAHGIAHILEGDLGNARYWYSRARKEFPPYPDATKEIAALKDELTRSSL
jgi:hypothetical protein